MWNWKKSKHDFVGWSKRKGLLLLSVLCNNKMIFYLHFVATMTLASSSQIHNNTFYYLETVTNAIFVADVFREIPLTKKILPVFECGVECSMIHHCTGIEICDDVSCRLWNRSFTSDTTINATKICQRYEKVSIIRWLGVFLNIIYSIQDNFRNNFCKFQDSRIKKKPDIRLLFQDFSINLPENCIKYICKINYHYLMLIVTYQSSSDSTEAFNC